MESRCVYSRCKNARLSNVLMVKFPEQRSLQLKWIDNIGNPSLLDLPTELLPKKSICLSHFDVKYRTINGGLVENAVPIRCAASEENVVQREPKAFLGHGKKCVYFGCGKSRIRGQCIRMTFFPRKRDLILKWIENIGAPHLLNLPIAKIRQECICVDHFDPKDFWHYRKRDENAVPIHYLKSADVKTPPSDVNVNPQDANLQNRQNLPSNLTRMPCSKNRGNLDLQPLTVNVTPSMKSYSKPQDDYNFEFDESATVEILTPPLLEDEEEWNSTFPALDNVDPFGVTEEEDRQNTDKDSSQPCLMVAGEGMTSRGGSTTGIESSQPCLMVAGEVMKSREESLKTGRESSQPCLNVAGEVMKSRGGSLKTGRESSQHCFKIAEEAIKSRGEPLITGRELSQPTLLRRLQPKPLSIAVEGTKSRGESLITGRELSQPTLLRRLQPKPLSIAVEGTKNREESLITGRELSQPTLLRCLQPMPLLIAVEGTKTRESLKSVKGSLQPGFKVAGEVSKNRELLKTRERPYSSKYSKNKCVYLGCKNSRHAPVGLKMYRFPPLRSVQLKWIENVGAPHLINLPYEDLRKKRVCVNHFEPEDIWNLGKNFTTRVPIHYSRLVSVETPLTPSRLIDVIETPLTPSTSIDVIETTLTPSTSIDVIETTLTPSASIDVIETTLTPSTSIDVIETTLTPSRSIDVIGTSLTPSRSVDVNDTPLSPSWSVDVVETPLSPVDITQPPPLARHITRVSRSPPLTLNVTPSLKCYSKPQKVFNEVEIETYAPVALSPPSWVEDDWNISENEDETAEHEDPHEEQQEATEDQLETAELDNSEELDVLKKPLIHAEYLNIRIIDAGSLLKNTDPLETTGDRLVTTEEQLETTELPETMEYEDRNDFTQQYPSLEDQEHLNSEKTITGTPWEIISYSEGDQELLKPIVPLQTCQKVTQKQCLRCSELKKQLTEANKKKNNSLSLISKLKKKIETARLETKLSKFLLDCKGGISASSES